MDSGFLLFLLILIAAVVAIVAIWWFRRNGHASVETPTARPTLAPSTPAVAATSVGSAPARETPAAGTGDKAAHLAQLTGAIMALDGRHQILFEKMSNYVNSENHRAAIEIASQGVALIDGFLSENGAALAESPDTRDRYTGDLVTYLGTRAAERFTYAVEGGGDRRELLKGAEEDATRALSFPARNSKIYRDPDVRSNLELIRTEARRAR